jgi:hypothetical protein
LPDRNLPVGARVEEVAGFTIAASPEGLLASLVTDADCALNDSRTAALCLILGLPDELFSQSLTFMRFADG